QLNLDALSIPTNPKSESCVVYLLVKSVFEDRDTPFLGRGFFLVKGSTKGACRRVANDGFARGEKDESYPNVYLSDSLRYGL
ncbi:hypothetical protein IscW_ISCW020723, partial [Ixodes scapularis]